LSCSFCRQPKSRSSIEFGRRLLSSPDVPTPAAPKTKVLSQQQVNPSQRSSQSCLPFRRSGFQLRDDFPADFPKKVQFIINQGCGFVLWLSAEPVYMFRTRHCKQSNSIDDRTDF
jgi:hypothetical protein